MKKSMRETISYFSASQIISHKSSFGRKVKNFYRSETEHLFARCLDTIGIKHHFERDAFKLKNENDIYVHYVPDFYIEGTNLYIEITNHMTRKTRHKILMFQQQYPHLKLMILNRLDVRKFARCEIDIDFDAYKINQ